MQNDDLVRLGGTSTQLPEIINTNKQTKKNGKSKTKQNSPDDSLSPLIEPKQKMSMKAKKTANSITKNKEAKKTGNETSGLSQKQGNVLAMLKNTDTKTKEQKSTSGTSKSKDIRQSALKGQEWCIEPYKEDANMTNESKVSPSVRTTEKQ